MSGTSAVWRTPLSSTHPPTRVREWVSYEANLGMCVVLDRSRATSWSRELKERATRGICVSINK